MSSVLTARFAYWIAFGLLLVCALIVHSTVAGFRDSQRRVEHSQQVEVLLGDTESAIASAARARLTYVFSGDDAALAQYEQYLARIPVKLHELRQSTKDDAVQQSLCDQLDQLVNDRVQLWQKSVELKKSNTPEPPGQPDLTRQSVAFADEIISVTQKMRAEEAKVVAGGRASVTVSLILTRVILATSFITAVLLLFWHYRLLREELHARQDAESRMREAAQAAKDAEHKARQSENVAIASTEAARRLSGRLLHLQDEERRRLSRELHDSTGQYLAAAKMSMAPLVAAHPGDRKYAECMEMLDRALQEVRTISHLLHPSGLEEAGFAAAARWYAEEFAKRSGVQLKVDISNPPARLSRDVEIALFRVLQESLTNIHRHSQSRSAEVNFKGTDDVLTLTIQDHGVGISKDVLQQFEATGTAGVGLAGMRERVRELGGNLELSSNGAGTILRVTVPMRKEFARAVGD
ncbi:MAG TPA: CHASE3 domain-containing protein [Terriglobales bacterium]